MAPATSLVLFRFSSHGVSCVVYLSRYFRLLNLNQNSRLPTKIMTHDAPVSPWLKQHIDSLYSQDLGEDTRRIRGHDFEDFRRGYIDSLSGDWNCSITILVNLGGDLHSQSVLG